MLDILRRIVQDINATRDLSEALNRQGSIPESHWHRLDNRHGIQ